MRLVACQWLQSRSLTRKFVDAISMQQQHWPLQLLGIRGASHSQRTEALLNYGCRIIGQRYSDRHHLFKRRSFVHAAARLALVTLHVCLDLTFNQRQTFCKPPWQWCYLELGHHPRLNRRRTCLKVEDSGDSLRVPLCRVLRQWSWETKRTKQASMQADL